MKPEPRSLPADLRRVALDVVTADKFPVLASMDGDQPRVRPVSPVRTDGFVVYVASLRSSHKTAEIEANKRVELCYVTDTHDQVRITGVAERETDAALIDDIWRTNPLLRSYLGTPDNPEFILYRIEPTHVRFMREWALDYESIAI